MATNVDYIMVLQDAAEQGAIMATNKHAILTIEEFKRLSLNNNLSVDILNDKYRAYRNSYVATLHNEATDKALEKMGL